MATGICPFCGKTVDKFIMFRGDIVGCRYCGIHTKQTNADRIRSLSDEELAEELWAWNQVCCYKWTKDKILDWLKKESKGDT